MVQWFTLAVMTWMAILTAATDHGVLMAINCFFLGYLFCAMLMGKLMDRRMAKADALLIDLKAAQADAEVITAKCQQAINDGYIEVVPIVPDDEQPPILH